MKQANPIEFFEKKSDYCERSSSTPVKTFVPHQAITLRELVSRFERGQRLNVHSNFTPGDNFTRDKAYVEDFDDAPPHDITDVVDVEHYYRAHQEHVKDFKARQKAKKAQQATPKEAPPANEPAPGSES